MNAPHKVTVSASVGHLDSHDIEIVGPIGDNVRLAAIARAQAQTTFGYQDAYVRLIRQSGDPIPDKPGESRPGLVTFASFPEPEMQLAQRVSNMEVVLAKIAKHFEREDEKPEEKPGKSARK